MDPRVEPAGDAREWVSAESMRTGTALACLRSAFAGGHWTKRPDIISADGGQNHKSEQALFPRILPRRAPPRGDRCARERIGLRTVRAGVHQFPAAHLGWRCGLRPHHGIRLPSHIRGDRAAPAVRLLGDRAERQAGPRLVIEIRRRRPQRLRPAGAHRRHEREGPGGRHPLFPGLCRLCQSGRHRSGEGAGAVGIPHLGADQLRAPWPR